MRLVKLNILIMYHLIEYEVDFFLQSLTMFEKKTTTLSAVCHLFLKIPQNVLDYYIFEK